MIMFTDMLKQIYASDCKTPGVSYKICGKFFIPYCNCFAVAISERGLQGSPDEKRFYSLFDLKDLSVISRDSERYFAIVELLPDFNGCKLTTSEPFKRWHYIKDFEELLEVYTQIKLGSPEENPYEVVREKYITFLKNMRSIKDKSMNEIYDYFISIA